MGPRSSVHFPTFRYLGRAYCGVLGRRLAGMVDRIADDYKKDRLGGLWRRRCVMRFWAQAASAGLWAGCWRSPESRSRSWFGPRP